MFDNIPTASEARETIQEDIAMRREEGLLDFRRRIETNISAAIDNGEYSVCVFINTRVWDNSHTAGCDMQDIARALNAKGYDVSIRYNVGSSNSLSHAIEISWKGE